jgi:hypothetical protein
VVGRARKTCAQEDQYQHGAKKQVPFHNGRRL